MVQSPPRAKLPLLYLPLVALVAAQTMCTSFGVDSPAGSGPDAAVAPDSAANDSGPGDAGDSAVEASAQPGCAGHGAAAFCEDFDDHVGHVVAFQQAQQHGTSALDIAFKGGFSAPNAARFVIPGSTSDAGVCNNEQNCEGAASNLVRIPTGPTSHLRLAFRVRVVTTRLDAIYIFFAKTSDVQLNFAVQDNQLLVNTAGNSDAGAVYGQTISTTLTKGSWTEIVVDEQLTRPATVTLRVGASAPKDVPLSLQAVVATSTSECTLQIGGDYNNIVLRSFEALVDDVVVESLP